MQMYKIGIITNEDKDTDLTYTDMLVRCILRNGGQVKLKSLLAQKIGMHDEGLKEKEVFEQSDILICLGGDGTFLKVARVAYKRKLPILGINLGNMGFLTEVEKGDIENAVDCLLKGNYNVENRMMLDSRVFRANRLIASDVALNDVVVSRGALSRILRLKTYINNTFVDLFPADGLIVSSPTGSTAYSLSAGGPIVEPDLDLLIVTPICPHILYSRSFITTGDRSVRVIVAEDANHVAMVTVDGQEGYEIRGGDMVEVKRSIHTVKLIRIHSRNFFNVLRKKIYYRGESLKGDEV